MTKEEFIFRLTEEIHRIADSIFSSDEMRRKTVKKLYVPRAETASVHSIARHYGVTTKAIRMAADECGVLPMTDKSDRLTRSQADKLVQYIEYYYQNFNF